MRLETNERYDPAIDGVVVTVDVFNDDLTEMYGRVRFEILSGLMLVNPQVPHFTKDAAKAVKEAAHNVGRELCKKWEFERAFIASKFPRLVKFYSDGKAIKITEKELVPGTGEHLYMYRV